MSNGVRVESLDGLRQFRAGLCKLAEQAQATVSEVQTELARAEDWLRHTQAQHWKQQLRLRTEAFNQARSALLRKRQEKTPAGGRYSCVEEEQAFQRAERRLDEARDKLAAVQRWTRKLDEAAHAYHPAAQRLMTTVAADVPRAVARLDQMTDALEAYLQHGGQPAWVESEATPAESMGRAAPDLSDRSDTTRKSDTIDKPDAAARQDTAKPNTGGPDAPALPDQDGPPQASTARRAPDHAGDHHA